MPVFGHLLYITEAEECTSEFSTLPSLFQLRLLPALRSRMTIMVSPAWGLIPNQTFPTTSNGKGQASAAKQRCPNCAPPKREHNLWSRCDRTDAEITSFIYADLSELNKRAGIDSRPHSRILKISKITFTVGRKLANRGLLMKRVPPIGGEERKPSRGLLLVDFKPGDHRLISSLENGCEYGAEESAGGWSCVEVGDGAGAEVCVSAEDEEGIALLGGGMHPHRSGGKCCVRGLLRPATY